MAKNLKFYCCIFQNSFRQRIYDDFEYNYLFDWQVKMPILARFTNFCDFHDFRKAAARNCILKNSNGKFWDSLFFFLFVQKFLFSSNIILYPGKLNVG